MGTMTLVPTDPVDSLFSLSRAFMWSRAFGLAVKLGLYELLAKHDKGLTLAEVTSTLQLNSAPGFKGVEDWLDLLVSVNVLDRDGEGAEARYRNLESLVPYLVPGKPLYIGGIMKLNHERSYWHFLHLETALKTGAVPDMSAHGIKDPLSLFSTKGDDHAAFAHGMTGASIVAFEAFAEHFDFAPHRSLSDLGGSLGVLAVAVAKRHPHMLCRSYDLPAMTSAAEEYVAAHPEVGRRVKVRELDFINEAFPCSDIITMSMVLHDWGAPKKLEMMRKAFSALPPGGAFVAIDNVIDDDRRGSTQALAVSINMCLEFGKENAAEYTFKEFQGWAKQAEYTSTFRIHLHGSRHACVAIK